MLTCLQIHGKINHHLRGDQNNGKKLATEEFVLANAESGSSSSVEATSIILSSPNGTRFSITIGDDGVLSATEIIEEYVDMLVENGSMLLDSDGSETESTTRLRSVDYYPYNKNVDISAEICGISSSSGEITVNNARMYTNYIAVEEGSNLQVECSNGYYIKAFCFGENVNYLGSGVFIGDLSSSTINGTVPANTSYIRILFKKSNNSNFTENELLNTQITINGTIYTLKHDRLIIDSTNLPYDFIITAYDSDKNYI